MNRTSKITRMQTVLSRNRPLATLMLGHFTVDMYVGLLPVLYPLLMERFTLDLKTVGLISLAYSGVASLSQPFFGWIADHYGTRFTGLALLWTAIMFATIGFAPSFPILIVLAAFAGMGSGAFHPLGAVNASAVIPEAQRNTAMSVYVTGGTFGVASGPLVGALVFALFGVRGTALMILPGVSIALWLLYEMRSIALPRPERSASGPVKVLAPIPLATVAVIVGVMMARMWTLFGIQAFIPTWYRDLGYSASFYGPLATTIVLASAVGAIGSGRLADRFGRREVILWSLVLSIPPLLLFTWITGPWAFLFGGLIGLSAASTGPLLLVMAQQLMQGRAGVASGVILGLGFVTGAIGVPVMGALADNIGIPAAMRVQVVVVLATIGLAWLLPSDERVRDLSRVPAAPGRARAAEAS
ncbi:MAG: MFS transporter [Thermomicrobiales bacterium]